MDPFAAGPLPAAADLPPKPSERLLIEAWHGRCEFAAPQRVLCTSQGRGQLAREIAARSTAIHVACYFIDAYLAALAHDVAGARTNLAIRCEPDFAMQSIDLAALPLVAQGDAEFTRETLQQAHERLDVGGVLLASTDNPRDTWLGEVLQTFGPTVRRTSFADGAVYELIKSAPLRRVRDFTARFAFRDRGRLFDVVSRPGTFSHRRIDSGARHLINAVALVDGERVLDIGCGWGAVSLAAAAHGPNVTVEAIDSNARAIECTRVNAAANGLGAQIVARVEAFGRVTTPGGFDLALGNPPYYADFRIARLFAEAAFAALRPGGRLTFVTKFPQWYLEHLPARFEAVEAVPIKGYHLVRGRRRS